MVGIKIFGSIEREKDSRKTKMTKNCKPAVNGQPYMNRDLKHPNTMSLCVVNRQLGFREELAEQNVI